MLVGDNRDLDIRDRQADHLADQVLVALILRVHGDRTVAQHGFRARGGHHQLTGAIGQRIGEMPEMALGLAVLHFQVRDRGLEMRIPVHQPLVAINEALLVQFHKHFQHRLGQALVQGEALTRPVTAGAQPAQLLQDRPAAFLFPLPDPLDESLTAHVPARDIAFLGQLALDHHLRGDTRMVGARLPQHRTAQHALVAHQHVLQRVVQRVTDMQTPRDVGRRNDDGEGFRIVIINRLERTGLLPRLIDRGFGVLGIECLVHHGDPRLFGLRTRALALLWQSGRESQPASC